MWKNSRLILALDVEPEAAKRTVRQFAPDVGIFKIGMRLFTALGPEIVRWVNRQERKVFLDLKFHDIPSTVAESCRNAVRMRVWGLTVHASGGFAMMKEAAKSVREEAAIIRVERPLIFGVSVLTSLQDNDLKEIGLVSNTTNQVKRMSLLAKKSGLDGVIASGREIQVVRASCGKAFLIATPGIRKFVHGDFSDDQKRVVSPSAAVRLGAHYIIIGRAILKEKNRVAALRAIAKEIREQ